MDGDDPPAPGSLILDRLSRVNLEQPAHVARAAAVENDTSNDEDFMSLEGKAQSSSVEIVDGTREPIARCSRCWKHSLALLGEGACREG